MSLVEGLIRDYGDFRIEKSVTDADAGILVGYLTGKRGNRASSAAQRQQAR